MIQTVRAEDVSTFEELEEDPDGAFEAYENAASVLERYRLALENVNDVSRARLSEIPGITLSDVDALCVYRTENGRLEAASEVDSIAGLTPVAAALFKRLFSFGRTDAKAALSVDRQLNIRLSAGRSWRSGQSGPAFAASPYRRTVKISGQASVRILALSGILVGALTAQNDPYEAFRWDPGGRWYGFDHLAGFLLWRPDRLPLEFIAGDFKVDVGQGIVLAKPFGNRIDPSSPWRTIRSASGLSGYSGSTFQPTMSGLGMWVGLPLSFSVSLFASRRSVGAASVTGNDWTGDGDGQEDATVPVVRLVQSGSHVSPEQIARRRALTDESAGIVLEWNGARARFGLQYDLTRTSQALILNERPRNRYDHTSFYWSVSTGRWTTAGEAAFAPRLLGVTVGVEYRPDRSTRLFATGRYFPAFSRTVYGSPYGFRNIDSRQGGLLVGAGLSPSKLLRIAISFDLAYAGGTETTAFFPTQESVLRVAATYEAVESVAIRLQFIERSFDEVEVIASATGAEMSLIRHHRISRLGVAVRYRLLSSVEASFRVDASAASGSSDGHHAGVHLGQTLSLRPVRTLRIAIQGSLFDAPTFENRFYVYEPDLSGRINVPALQNSGIRTMILVAATILKATTLELKYAVQSSTSVVDAGGINPRPHLEALHSRTLGIQLAFTF